MRRAATAEPSRRRVGVVSSFSKSQAGSAVTSSNPSPNPSPARFFGYFGRRNRLIHRVRILPSLLCPTAPVQAAAGAWRCGKQSNCWHWQSNLLLLVLALARWVFSSWCTASGSPRLTAAELALSLAECCAVADWLAAERGCGTVAVGVGEREKN